MTAMLMPSVNSYFAIYTLMNPSMAEGAGRRSAQNWDLHATATDRSLAMSHARMLVLQPGVNEVHVKQVDENLASGHVSVRNVKCWKRGGIATRTWACAGLAALMAITLITLVF